MDSNSQVRRWGRGALPAALQIGEFAPELQAAIDTELDCFSEQEILDNSQLKAVVRVILTRSNYTIAPMLLNQLPGLQIIATSGVGYDGIPVAQAHLRHVVVTHTPGILDGAVAELAIGLLRGLLRQIPSADRFVRDGKWSIDQFPLAVGLARKRVGIVGLGRIGKSIAKRLLPFEVSLSYCGSSQQDVPYPFFRCSGLGAGG